MRIIIVLFCLLFSTPAFGTISFSSGKWSTTFNCADWVQNNSFPSCDGLAAYGGWTAASHGDQIVAGANNTNGDGGGGFRHWRGDGSNRNGGGIIATFPSAQKEIWVRWYERYQSGFKWSTLGYSKELYINTGGANISVIPEFYYGQYAIIAEGTPNYYQVTSNFGWPSVMGGDTADGLFHAYEIHLKMDTIGSNGIGQLWIDGVLKANNTSVNWSNGNSSAKNGWLSVQIGSNQSTPNNGGDMYDDFDDMAIYNTTPLSIDAQGNPFIGLIGGGSLVATKLVAPTNLKIY